MKGERVKLLPPVQLILNIFPTYSGYVLYALLLLLLLLPHLLEILG